MNKAQMFSNKYKEIIGKGDLVLALRMTNPNKTKGELEGQEWVRAVAKKADADVNYIPRGGDLHMFHRGDRKSRERVEKAITELQPTLKGKIVLHPSPSNMSQLISNS